MKRRVAIDVDGVLRDFQSSAWSILSRAGEVSGAMPISQRWELWEEWGMSKVEFERLVYQSDYTDDIFRNANAYDGAREFCAELWNRRNRFDLGILTSQTSTSWMPTLCWLVDHVAMFFSEIVCASFSHKSDSTFDILLDDSLSSCRHFASSRLDRRAFVFDRPWNQGLTGDAVRVYSYREFLEQLDLEARCENAKV